MPELPIPAASNTPFRRELYRCFTAGPDVLFELADAVLCADGPVRTLVGCRWRPSITAATARYMTR
jgi:hypothetical protein